MSFPYPPGSVQEKLFLERVIPNLQSNPKLLKNHQFYSTLPHQNLWENHYRSSPKLKKIGNVMEHKLQADKHTAKLINLEKDQNKEENCQKLANRRVQSASRSSQRQFEYAQTQLKSAQPLKVKEVKMINQKKLNGEEQQRIVMKSSGKIAHIVQIVTFANKEHQNSWNRCENICTKNLKQFYTKFCIKKEKEALDNMEKRYQYEQQIQQQKQDVLLQNKALLKQKFQQRQEQNAKMQFNPLKNSNSPKAYPPPPPLFQRLSQTKQVYVPENKYERAEFNGFITTEIRRVDMIKNPLLVNYFKETEVVQNNLNLDGKYESMGVNYKDPPQPEEYDTVDMENLKIFKHNFQHDELINDIDEFEKKLCKVKIGQQYLEQKQEFFSEIKNKEQKYLQSTEGFKELKRIKSSNTNDYRYNIGRVLTQEKLKNE